MLTTKQLFAVRSLYRVYTGQNWPGTARYGAGTVIWFGAGRCLHYGNRKWAECVFERSSVNNGRVVSREHSAALALVLSTSSSSRSKSFSSSSQSSLKRRRHQAHLRLARFKQAVSEEGYVVHIFVCVSSISFGSSTIRPRGCHGSSERTRSQSSQSRS